MRVSDQARERTLKLLRRRCTEGYLSLDTYERRVAEALAARDSGQLAELRSDLPAVGLLARLGEWRPGTAAAPPEAVRLPLELVGERTITLGRSRYSDVVIDHDTVSRRHAEIWREGERCYVNDLGSTNGTWVDGSRVEYGRRIAGGDQILLGGCLVVVL